MTYRLMTVRVLAEAFPATGGEQCRRHGFRAGGFREIRLFEMLPKWQRDRVSHDIGHKFYGPILTKSCMTDLNSKHNGKNSTMSEVAI